MKDKYVILIWEKGDILNKRHTQILDLLTEHKKMEVTKLSELLNVSQVTIRKDLVALEKSGIIVRVHGYAMINESDDINHRLAYHYEIKQSIAKKADRKPASAVSTLTRLLFKNCSKIPRA